MNTYIDGSSHRKGFSISFKHQVNSWKIKNNANNCQVARHFKTSRRNVQRWWAKREDIKLAVGDRHCQSRKQKRLRLKKAVYPELSEACVRFIKESREKGLALNAYEIKRFARSEYIQLYPDHEGVGFRATSGWFRRFSLRNNIVKRRVTSVGQKVPPDAVERAERFLARMMDYNKMHYSAYYNCDETPLYFDLPSGSSFDFRGVSSVKVKTTGYEKLRFTVLLTAGVVKNSAGNWIGHKLPPMIIFKNIQKAPKGKFPKGMVVEGSKGGTMTHEFMENVYLPKTFR